MRKHNQGGTATDLAPVMGRGFIFVGADAHIGPAERTVFSVIFGEFVTSQWADVGIGPYRALCRFAAAQRAEQGPASTNRI